MKKLAFLLILFGYSAVSQTIYQVNEVEKAAEPNGGVIVLNQFISANIQIPIRQAAKGMNTRVFVKGIVEPDGSMSGLEIARSADSVSDKEALRLMSLYKAWKPAKIKDQNVRQATTFPVIFRTAPIPDFDSTDHSITEYFDKDNTPTSDPKKYKFRNSIPVDDFGFVRADILNQELRGGKWKTLHSIPFKKEEIWVKMSGDKPDSIKAFRISAQMGNWASASEELIVQPDGKRLSYTAYPGSGKPPKSGKFYYLTGMLKEEQLDAVEFARVINWYDNGQIRSITELSENKSVSIRESWDRDGTQTVKEGTGSARILGIAYNGRTIYEAGLVAGGNKTGRWTGKFSDSTMVYEEFYENGILKKGKSTVDGDVEYDDVATVEPQFKGGKDKMFQFLGKNMAPATFALRATDERAVPSFVVNEDKSWYEMNRRSRVVVSFVVNEDGSLSDYRIENSVLPTVDQEVLRVVKLMNGMWEPGSIKGRKVKLRYSIPINFQ